MMLSIGNFDPQVAAGSPTTDINTNLVSRSLPLIRTGPSNLAVVRTHRVRTPVPIEVPSDDSSDADAPDVGDGLHNPDDVCVGMIFSNRSEFRIHMAMYAIKHKFKYKLLRSRPELMLFKCIGRVCPWRVYATKMHDSDGYQVRKVSLSHQCTVDERRGYDRQVSSAMIASIVGPKYAARDAGPRPSALQKMMLDNHGVRVSYWKAWRSREHAMDYANGASSSAYNLLPFYAQQLVRENPNTSAMIETQFEEGVGQRFKFMFVAMGASIAGWPYMRKVIVVDGTHLTGKYAGTLLTASAQDGDYHIYPIAFAIVDSENDKSWTWFFRNLAAVIGDEDDLLLISDRHASIYKAKAKVYPRASHGACIVHLRRNVQAIFKSDHLSYLVNKAARAYTKREFYQVFLDIKKTNKKCAEYLLDIGLEHWTRSHSKLTRYNLMTSNIAESWNKVLKHARELPINCLVEFIRSKMMEWWCARREAAARHPFTITPKIHDIISNNFELSTKYGVAKIAHLQYEVRDKDGLAYHVDLAKKTCSCLEFQTLLMPCSHAVGASI